MSRQAAWAPRRSASMLRTQHPRAVDREVRSSLICRPAAAASGISEGDSRPKRKASPFSRLRSASAAPHQKNACRASAERPVLLTTGTWRIAHTRHLIEPACKASSLLLPAVNRLRSKPLGQRLFPFQRMQLMLLCRNSTKLHALRLLSSSPVSD